MYALQIKDLRKTYGNGVEALKGISLNVAEGDFFGLLGPNGAGKSTLIGIVSSLVNTSSGESRVFDASVQTERSKAMSYIGLVPQELNFNQFEKPFEIVVNQAGYYGIPRSVATVSRGKIPATTAALGQGVQNSAYFVRRYETTIDDRQSHGQ